MNLNDLTIGQAKELANMFGAKSNTVKKLPFEIGKKYLLRTVTHIQVGQVKEICGDFLILENASWIADTGRWHDCLKNGEFDEVEPFIDDIGVNVTTLIDFTVWSHELPKSQK